MNDQTSERKKLRGRERAGEYQLALRTLRDRHRDEFDRILFEVRELQQPAAHNQEGR